MTTPLSRCSVQTSIGPDRTVERPGPQGRREVGWEERVCREVRQLSVGSSGATTGPSGEGRPSSLYLPPTEPWKSSSLPPPRSLFPVITLRWERLFRDREIYSDGTP